MLIKKQSQNKNYLINKKKIILSLKPILILYLISLGKMGAKKKNKNNKLAKMSEEEKIRYLQHKAAIKEEARRRKEQLISTFLKACITNFFV